jgi:hypothetical protein
MEPITLIFLSGALTGTVTGETFKPLGIPVDNANVAKECSVSTKSSKVYDKEIKLYIENVHKEEHCNTKTKDSEDIKFKNIKGH